MALQKSWIVAVTALAVAFGLGAVAGKVSRFVAIVARAAFTFALIDSNPHDVAMWIICPVPILLLFGSILRFMTKEMSLTHPHF